MRLVIGIDEAGYGPNLGPLVVAASVWTVEGYDIEQGLSPLFPEFRIGAWTPDCAWVPMGDSKKIHQRAAMHDGLFSGVQFLMHGCGSAVLRDWGDLLPRVAMQDLQRVESIPWYGPALASDSPEASRIAIDVSHAAMQKLRDLGISFHGFRSRILDEPEFNRAVANARDNKANALGAWSLGLARDALVAATALLNKCDAIEIYCDRLGGRKRYAPMLVQAWQDNGIAPADPPSTSLWFDVLMESSQISRYRTLWYDRPMTIQFTVDGDSLLPSAAASMLAKGIREHLMQRLNRFWRTRVGDHLAPTAGYAVDAQRFAADIAPARQREAIPDALWWRSR